MYTLSYGTEQWDIVYFVYCISVPFKPHNEPLSAYDNKENMT